MKRAAAAALLFGALTTGARAGYDKTKWGMTLAQVEKLYPGGGEAEQQGETSYTVLAPVAGVPGLVTFLFDEKNGLHEVAVVFPQQGARFDPKTDAYAPLATADATRVRELALQDLRRRYGPPAIQGEGADTPLGWATKDGDLVLLKTARDGPDRFTVSISYRKA
ncbi:MAG TPA: hypothetical protein VMK42_10210 [Anaeromyxobacteraceae bacterium]|nr:hypothetical protein [Anaeromyxobacteraceae bacterium]